MAKPELFARQAQRLGAILRRHHVIAFLLKLFGQTGAQHRVTLGQKDSGRHGSLRRLGVAETSAGSEGRGKYCRLKFLFRGGRNSSNRAEKCWRGVCFILKG